MRFIMISIGLVMILIIFIQIVIVFDGHDFIGFRAKCLGFQEF